MTAFGIIWMAILLILMFSKIKYLFFFTILSSVFQCDNVLVLGDSGIGPQVITSIAFIIRVFLLRRPDFKISKKILTLELVCISLLFVALISLIVNNVLNEQILRYMQLVVYVICFIAMTKISTKVNEDEIYFTIKNITIFLIVVGFLQLLITTGIFPRLGIIKTLLYNDNLSTAVYFTRNNYFRILSTYMEPSYYACFLVGAFYYFISLKERIKENYFLIALIFIQIILTFSSTAYVATFIVGLIYLTREKNYKVKIMAIIGGLVVFLILYYGFYDVLDTVIFSKAESGSANARFALNAKAIREYESHKIIGTGYFTNRASSVVNTILAEMGLVGLINYILINFIVIKGIFKNRNKDYESNQEIGLRFAILAVVIAQIVAVPVIDICAYWMWMNIFAVIMTLKKEKEVKEIE